ASQQSRYETTRSATWSVAGGHMLSGWRETLQTFSSWVTTSATWSHQVTLLPSGSKTIHPLGRQGFTKTTSTSPSLRMGSQFIRPSSWHFRPGSSTALATGGIQLTGQAQSGPEQAPGLPPMSTTPLGSSRPPQVGPASAAYPPLPGR